MEATGIEDPWVFIPLSPLLGPHLLPLPMLILKPRLPLMPGTHTTDVPPIMEDTTGMEATGIEVTMDFHMDMDIMPTADVLTAMVGPMVLTTALDLMFMANRNFIKK